MTTKQTGELTLYGYPQCPFCQRVMSTISSLGIDIPLRNTMEDPAHRGDLQKAVGRTTVPVLRIEDEAGDVEWLPESADITRYLASRFGSEDGR